MGILILKQYNISLSINLQYLPFAFVTIYSLLINNKTRFFNIFILHNNSIQQQDINKFLHKQPLNNLHNFKINLCDVSSYIQKANLKPVLRWPIEIFFKIFLCDIFLQLNQIIFLDSDVIINNNIEDFLNIDLNNYLLCGDTYPKNNYTNYLCVGVLIMNLKKMRDIKFKEQILNYRNHSPEKHEEYIINKLYNTDVKTLPCNYIFTTNSYYVNKQKINFAFKDIKIIHYNDNKPFNINKASHIAFNHKILNTYYQYAKPFVLKKDKIYFYLLIIYANTLAPIYYSYKRRLGKLLQKYFRTSVKIDSLTQHSLFYSVFKKLLNN